MHIIDDYDVKIKLFEEKNDELYDEYIKLKSECDYKIKRKDHTNELIENELERTNEILYSKEKQYSELK